VINFSDLSYRLLFYIKKNSFFAAWCEPAFPGSHNDKNTEPATIQPDIYT